jgi:hypothetical protein
VRNYNISIDTHSQVPFPRSLAQSTLISIGQVGPNFPVLISKRSIFFQDMSSQDGARSPLITYPPDAARPGYNYLSISYGGNAVGIRARDRKRRSLGAKCGGH